MFKTFFKQFNNKKGFTLIELIVVIAILGILLTIAVPKFSGFTEKAAKKADEVTMTVIANAAKIYYLDEQKNEVITIETLISKGLLEGKKEDYVAQSKDHKGKFFKIEINNGDITVEYDTSELDG